MPSDGSGAGATLTSIEAISKQIDLIASEAQEANLPKAADVLRAMAQLIRSLGNSADESVAGPVDDLPTSGLDMVH